MKRLRIWFVSNRFTAARVAFATCAALGMAWLSLPHSAHAAEAPKLVVLEASSEGVKADSLRSSDVAFTLTLHNLSNSAATNVHVHLSSFHSASLKTYVTNVDTGAPEFNVVEPHASKAFRISATLPEAGVHTARLIVTSNAETLDIPIVATRVADTTVAPLQPVPIKLGLLGDGEFSQDLVVHRTAGSDTSITIRARKLEYAPKDTVKLALPLPPEALAEGVAVAAGSQTHIPIKVPLPHAGAFNLELEYQLADSAPATTSVAIYAREAVWVAIAFIVLGILIATALRFILTELRPRSLGAERIVACRERLQRAAASTTDPIVRATIDRVGSQLQAHWTQFSNAAPADAEVALSAVELKIRVLEAWLYARALLPVGLPQEVRTEAEAALSKVQNALDSPYAQSAELQQYLTDLGTLPAGVNRRALQYAAQALGALASNLVRNPSNEARALRDDARTLAEQFPSASAADLASLFDRLDALQVRYVRLLSANLKAQLEGESPVTMAPAAWLRIRARALVELEEYDKPQSAAAALARYLAAVRAYAYPLLVHLMTILSSRIATDDAFKSQYESLFQRATTLRDQVATDAAPDVLEPLSQLIRDFDDVEHGGLNLLDAGGLATFVPTTTSALQTTQAGGQLLRLASFQWMPERIADLGDPARAMARTRRLSIFAGILALAVTLLLGVQTLWSSDWSWGGTNAYLLAILWGAGVYGFSFEGLNGLMNRLKT